MIPYLPMPVWQIGPFQVTAFGLCILLALMVGGAVSQWRAAALHLDPSLLGGLLVQAVIGGFAGSHVFAVLGYAPRELLSNPLVLLDVRGDMSALGGVLGGTLALLWVFLRERWPRNQALQYLDVITWGFIGGWIFGRLGCALAHDHPGILSSSWLAVQYPGGARLDLGVIESLGAALLMAWFWSGRELQRAPGSDFRRFVVVYAAFRLVSDALRVGEDTWLGLTATQWVCLCGLGLHFLRSVLKSPTYPTA